MSYDDRWLVPFLASAFDIPLEGTEICDTEIKEDLSIEVLLEGRHYIIDPALDRVWKSKEESRGISLLRLEDFRALQLALLEELM